MNQRPLHTLHYVGVPWTTVATVFEMNYSPKLEICGILWHVSLEIGGSAIFHIKAVTSQVTTMNKSVFAVGPEV